MTHYINKSALVAEIEKCINKCNEKKRSCPVNTQVEAICNNKINAYNEIISHINTLEVKEVDLEKEVSIEWDKCNPIDEGMGCEFANISIEQFYSIAKHFFELGLKAQKGD